jgi:hypothetical protein
MVQLLGEPGDWLPPGLAGAKRSMSDSSEGILDCSEKPQVSLMQVVADSALWTGTNLVYAPPAGFFSSVQNSKARRSGSIQIEISGAFASSCSGTHTR